MNKRVFLENKKNKSDKEKIIIKKDERIQRLIMMFFSLIDLKYIKMTIIFSFNIIIKYIYLGNLVGNV